jgi:hypothetical protein
MDGFVGYIDHVCKHIRVNAFHIAYDSVHQCIRVTILPHRANYTQNVHPFFLPCLKEKLSQQYPDLLQHLCYRLGWQLARQLRFSRTPIQTLYLIRQYHSSYLQP